MRKATNTTQVLAHLIGAMDAGRAVTLRYVKDNGEVSRRQIEVHSISTTNAGHFVVRAFDRRRGELRTFRLDRVTHYTLHRKLELAAYRMVVDVVLADREVWDEDELLKVQAWTPREELAA